MTFAKRKKIQAPNKMSFAERLEFYSMPEPNSGCQLWIGSYHTFGYGKTQWGRKYRGAHQIAWEVANARPIPTGMFVCHKCDVAACINPNHLFLGTQGDNMRDKVAKGRHNPTAGIKNRHAKLTDDLVREIRASPLRGVDAAKLYGVSETTICTVRSRRVWGHVE